MAHGRYCNETCRDAYRCDVRHGLIYGRVLVIPEDVPEHLHDRFPRHTVNGTTVLSVGWTTACDLLDMCRYCGADLNQHKPKERPHHEHTH